MSLGPLPPWALRLSDRLTAESHGRTTFDQLIVNEYQAGQGIARHLDCRTCFDDTIVSISLLSPCVRDEILPSSG